MAAKVGLIVGREWSFPPKFIEEVNRRDEGVVADFIKLGPTMMDTVPEYAVLVDRISHWTGLYDVIVRSLINHFIERCAKLELWLDPEDSEQTLIDLTACASALAMNRLYKGEFVLR